MGVHGAETGDPVLEGRSVVTHARALAVQRAVEAGRADVADDLALVASELVTNALFHGGGCRGIEFAAVADGVRIEVRDHTTAPPVFGHASETSLTGRGVRLVAGLSARWGVDLEPGGKVVWAEVTGEVHDGTGVDEQALLAMWGDDEWDVDQPRRFHVELGDVPTDLLLAAKSHVDNIVREFALASGGADSGVTAELPQHLSTLLDAVDRFAETRLAVKHHALDAVHRGEQMTRLALDLPASAADAAEEYLSALDEVDVYCRAMRMLTLETPPQHRLFRHWYVSELVTQLRAAAAGQEPPPPQPFERRILTELDRLVTAHRASDRAARLYSVAAALATADTPEAVAAAVLGEGVAALGAAGGGILLATDADKLAVPGAVGYDEKVLERLRNESRDAELPAAVALRTGAAVWLESRAERDSRFPELADLEARTVSLCAVPLEVQGRRLGAIRFSFNKPRLFGEDERRFVLTLAAQAAQALDRTQLQNARFDASRRLQRSLLPRTLPDIPGVGLAAIYHPFGDGMEVGGDFYDVWPIGAGRWALAIGDATGTGPEAAALTALVRNTLRTLTMTESEPGAIVRRLNSVLVAASEPDEERFCTAMFGVLDTNEGVELVLAGGGHPPLFVRRAGGAVEIVPVGGALLGAFAEPEVDTARVSLVPGDTAVLLTDGVLEARRDGVLFDTDGVVRVLSDELGDAHTVGVALQEAVLAHTDGQLSDDMAAVVVNVVG
ncbi:MAG TPA: ATP-binding SpoIIE family protein phosphatase [Acidimicrobiales bacterium]|nr:ATP-binding SpoIIE family protein phosphatase [Acidimicrobiales bacterium]